jgi:hypothetical protein
MDVVQHPNHSLISSKATRPGERCVFALALAGLITCLLHESLFQEKILSSADVVFAQRGWSEAKVEPSNRLLMDPVLQFEPWLELTRTVIRGGGFPIWNPLSGCGAPLLANGQSGVFDPFHLIAYLGPWPGSLAWIAAARLMTAGLGMFFLARAWRFGRLGSWFSGLAYPFTGFMIGWLMFPLASSAAWLPWLLLGIEQLRTRGDLGSGLRLGAIIAAVLLGGHIQTSIHVLMVGAIYALFAMFAGLTHSGFHRHMFLSGILGACLSAPAVLPLADYLTRSPAWHNRQAEFEGPRAVRSVRWKEAACWAVPYVYGSQRAGQPNLAKALGVENLNESVGGFAGLPTLLWLAPLGAWAGRRSRVTLFLLILLAFAVCGSLRVPPIDNLLRMIPALDVMDHRRLSLIVGFSLVGLGGIGLDHLSARPPRRASLTWLALWCALGIGLITTAAALPNLAPSIRARAIEHYSRQESGLDSAEMAARVDRQVDGFVKFLPRYYVGIGGEILLVGGMASTWLAQRGQRRWLGPLLVVVTLMDMLWFAWGLNPSIPREHFQADSPLLARLRLGLSPNDRVLGIGEELPPNLLMRYGIADVRNYDSIETSANLDAFENLYVSEPDRPTRSSRRSITWEGVEHASRGLREAGVRAVVGASSPPAGLFDEVEAVGSLRIGWWNSRRTPVPAVDASGKFSIALDPNQVKTSLIVPVTFEPGWRAKTSDGPLAISQDGAFMAVRPSSTARSISFEYRPIAVRIAMLLGGGALGIWLLGAIFNMKKGPNSLGVVSKVGLESILANRRTRYSRSAHSSGGRGADGPLQV